MADFTVELKDAIAHHKECILWTKKYRDMGNKLAARRMLRFAAVCRLDYVWWSEEASRVAS